MVGGLGGGVREAEAPGLKPGLGIDQACPDALLGYLFQLGILTTPVIDSQEEGSIKYDSCSSLLVTLYLSFLLLPSPEVPPCPRVNLPLGPDS